LIDIHLNGKLVEAS